MGKAATTNVSEHWKGQQFAGFKKMIGGERFYFFRDWGIYDNGAKSKQRAAQAAAELETEYRRLQLSGLEWTPATKAAARDRVKAIMGIAVAQPSEVPSPAEERRTMHPGAVYGAMAKKASDDGGHRGAGAENYAADSDPKQARTPYPKSPAAVDTPYAKSPGAVDTPAAHTLHSAIDVFLAEQKERVATKDIQYDHYEALEERMAALKRIRTDIPIAAFDRAAITAVVNYWKKRPPTLRGGKPVSVYTVKNHVTTLRQFVGWLYRAEEIGWVPVRAWEELFGVDMGNLQTAREKRAAKDGRDYFTVEELATLWKFATPRTCLYMALALNCGMGQKEISTLRTWDFVQGEGDKLPTHIDRERNKTGVKARWLLWDETATLVATFTSPYAAWGESIANQGKSPEYKREGAATDDDTDGLAFKTEDGYPLVHRGGAKNRKTDAVALAWGRLFAKVGRAYKLAQKEAAAAGTEKPDWDMPRDLGFYALRRTAAQMVRDFAGYETHKIFLAHSTLEASGRKSVSEKHYTARTQADFDKVAAALVEMRKRLDPMFPKAKKGKAA